MVSICGGSSATSCGTTASTLSTIWTELPELFAELVHTVGGVVRGPDSPADGDVVAVRIRVEVAAQRPERVVEIGDVVAHLVGDRHRVFCAGYVMSRSDQLVHQNVHALQRFDGSAELVGQLGHVIQPALGDLQVLQLSGILHAEQERNRGVLERCALRPRNALHPSDSLDAEDALGQLVQDQEVRRIAHVVIGLDHQHLGHHARLREMPLRGGHSDVAGGVLRYVVAVDVAHLVTRQREQADHGDRARRGENRCRPTHDGGAHSPPTATTS